MEYDSIYIFLDNFFNLFFLTPLIVAFWSGTYLLIDLLIWNPIDNPFLASWIILAIGMSIEFVASYWQDYIDCLGSCLGPIPFFFYTRAYNYILGSGNIIHYRGIFEIYKLFFQPDNLLAAVIVTFFSLMILWLMRVGKNITSPPFDLTLDIQRYNWFEASTYFDQPKSNFSGFLGDVLVTVIVIYSLSPIHWVGLTSFFDIIIFPSNPFWSAIVSLILGYAIIIFCNIIQILISEKLKQYAKERRTTAQKLLENLFVWSATVGTILIWRGLDIWISGFVESHPFILQGIDLTAWVLIGFTFITLTCCYVSSCLVTKGVEKDCTGEDLKFSRDYFRHFQEERKVD